MKNTTQNRDDELTTFTDVTARWSREEDRPEKSKSRKSKGYKLPTADYTDIDERKVKQARKNRQKINQLIGC